MNYILSYIIMCVYVYIYIYMGFPGGSDGKESTWNAKRLGFNPWVWKIPWRREQLPTPVFLLENSVNREAWQATGHKVANSQTWLNDFHFFFTLSNLTTFPYMHWNSRKYLSKCPPHTFLDKLMFFFLL